MSPQWRDEIRLQIAPSEIRVTRMNRGVRPTHAGEIVRSVTPSGLQWQAALSALQELFDDATWRAAHVRITVSNLWARYAIVPWDPRLVSEDERLAHARICLAGTYGNIDDAWRVCLSDAAPGEPRLACALPEALLADIAALLEPRRMRLVSLQPLLVSAYNEWRHRLPAEGGWFVCVEDGALTAARLSADAWDRVYAARIGADWSRELLRLRAFARVASSSSESGRVFVHAPPRFRSLASVEDTGLEWLSTADDTQPGDSIATVVRLPV